MTFKDLAEDFQNSHLAREMLIEIMSRGCPPGPGKTVGTMADCPAGSASGICLRCWDAWLKRFRAKAEAEAGK
jgi:hypothetical protein